MLAVITTMAHLQSHKRMSDIPIGILALIVSQVIQIDDQPDLVIVQHPPNGFTVIVVGIGLSCQLITFSAAYHAGQRISNEAHIVVQELDKATTSIPHQVIREDRSALLGVVVGHIE